mmetsp:Transcript_11984/g.34643  ORF Transcript_11984/g.34643 Transcript_11984/m.34643 type:complete len:469 (-) Transcript_11984:65-1471(-)|eukprot:CAMPEP_0119563482 /NCGR_PEP_ID=MMETSP1352-20130426/23557_1 /TAXON_ID=265584 /ORGANISM="Stauroneis constricta, Strain CCMP1120" /LENGTH=468 /DNA_ID=CAMNT_0007612085 /DNA_START=184 /DNA_END=1590 /DNA_ORIENTATION=+
MVSMTRKRVKLGRRRNGGVFSLPFVGDWTGVILMTLLAIFIATCFLISIIIQKTNDFYGTADHGSYYGSSASEFDNWLSSEDHKFPNRHNKHRRLNQFPRDESLRYSFELAHGLSWDRTLETVRKARIAPDQIPIVPNANMTYNVYDCPETPPPGYPFAWNVIDVLSNWNPDDTKIPDQIHQGLCSFDWSNPSERDVALTYRKAELPFLIRNHEELWKTAERWSSRKYMLKLLGPDKEYKTEHSKNNHMMYWKLRGRSQVKEGWEAPTDITKLNFEDWYQKATELENYDPTTGDAKPIIDKDHWYFRLNAAYRGQSDFVYDELPMFVPEKPGFFMVDPKDERGVNCRFGMKGIIAETHYDFSRNFVFILKGQKRYVLAHPNQCKNMMLHPSGHPSARHSSIDWSNPDEWQTGNFPNGMVNEVVLQAGDALYLPTAWFHFIVSLNLNYQCNARSGITYENQEAITECGF